MKELFQLRDARFLILANCLTVFGDTSLLLVLAIWAKELTGSTGAAGGIYIAVVVPSALAPLAGPLIDRLPRRLVMGAVNMAAGGCVLGLLLVDSAGRVWVLFCVAALFGLALVVFQGARSGLVVSLVPPHLLAQGNAVLRTSRQMLSLASPLIGAGLYAAVGGRVVAVVVSVSLVLSALCLLPLAHVEEVLYRGSEPIRRQLGAGARHLLGHQVLRRLLGVLCVSLLVTGFYEIALFDLVDTLGRSPAFMGALVSVQGAGAVVGGVTASATLHRFGDVTLVALGFAVQGAALLFTLAGSLVPALVGVALFGLGLPWILVGSDTCVMTRTASELQGRVNTALEAVTSIPYTLSYALAAGLIGLTGFRPLVVAMTAVSFLCWALLRRTVREST
ncbi:MFS transporter [Streptomyces venezuelae]|uniref:MFS transporter n=1 Tax=Streptomyces venezuelae TaxID=54571 RepID=UPI0037A1718D